MSNTKRQTKPGNTYTRQQLNKYNVRITKLNKGYRTYGLRSKYFGEQFAEAAKQFDVLTGNAVSGYGKTIDPAKVSALSLKDQKRLFQQLDSLMERSTVKAIKTHMTHMKGSSGMRTAFKNHGLDVSKLTDAEYDKLWKKMNEISERFHGQKYTSDQDEEDKVLEATSKLFKEYSEGNIDESTLDEVIDRMTEDPEAFEDAVEAFVYTMEGMGL